MIASASTSAPVSSRNSLATARARDSTATGTANDVTGSLCSELQSSKAPVQYLLVRLPRGVDHGPELQNAATGFGQRHSALDMQLAVEGVALVDGSGVVAGLPAQHRHDVGQQPRGL